MSIAERFITHRVENQVPALGAYNAYLSDRALREAVGREGGGWADELLARFGTVAGGEMMELGFAANENKPRLRAFERTGERIDEVDYHPAYHRLMQLGMQHGVHAFAWRQRDTPGAHVARAALFYMHYQAESGTCCPLTMTHAVVPALQRAGALAAEWLPRVTSLDYDPRSMPAAGKRGCTMGMGMTEKQGGSDVRANTTRAFAQADGSHEIVGHKWFFSAPMSDAWLVLAQTDAGLTCFLLPRWNPDGSRNAIRLQRLKDKLGDWSNASSEVEFHGARAERIGEEGRGVATILEMVALTRLDCMTGSAGLMRQATVQALHHARHRSAFGKRLVEQALMKNVLADLAVESEAATALSFRVARAVDAAGRDPSEAALARIATALGKYWVCKRAPALVNEAQECLGGAGYVEESMLPRLYRQAPLNSIWEGAGNIQCLDVLRALGREPETRDAFFAELGAARGASAELDREAVALGQALDDRSTLEARARRVVERMTLALQASILARAGNDAVARAFCASRLGADHGTVFGTLPPLSDIDALVERSGLAD
ncbi:MAG TPA: isovaleryl-CoA dehydrogenase [Caldimonas sp.]|jgi:putative acyl-CoA dehydrogenase|nr:isovaleryl-CoA dehydrogenase [Caldimonas sp.]HEX2542638.1 isovaleryl-CoA dehydrogenase [Caldimonas sp.]